MKSKTLMKILSVFLTVVMVLCSAPLSGFVGIKFPEIKLPEWDLFDFSVGAEAEALTEGIYTYEVSDGKATITDCNTSISGNIVIPSTLGGYPVTSIGDGAFRSCTGLSTVTIPDSVTSIGDSSFRDCNSLTSITIPDSVTSVGICSFDNCTSLMLITIPDSVTSIGDSAFCDCTGLKSITIGNSVTSIGSYAFYNTAYYNDSTNWENDVLYIGDYLIVAKTNLSESYEIKDGTTVIADNAFDYCESLKSVTIPDSVTSIGGSAFYDCIGLTSIAISDGVTSIGSYAFYKCTSLKSVTIGDSVTNIGSYAFYNCTRLTSITIPDSITSIDSYAFENCTNLADVYYTGGIDLWCDIEFDNFCANPIYYAKNFYVENKLVNEVVIPNSVTEIKNYVFYSFERMTSIIIPSSVTNIGDSAFENCTGLKLITIGNSVISIGSYAFYNTAYYNDSTNWENDVLYIGDYLIVAKTNLSGSYEIKYGTTVISEGTFEDCTSLKSVTIPNSVISIGNVAFSDCKGLTSIIIPNSVINIGNGAFSDCTNLKSVTIGDGVTNIGFSAFSGCTGLTSITIPDSVTSIGSYAFYHCYSLKSVTISDNVTNIGDYAFGYCYGFRTIIIPDSMTSIDSRVFYKCTGLASITIPGSVTSIGWNAFYGCSAMKMVYFEGTEAEWEEVVIYAGNDSLTNSTVICLADHTHFYNSTVNAPTCTENGLEIFTCLCCDTYTEIVPATGHSQSEPVEENSVEVTCLVDGSYDVVIYCMVCKVELSRETKFISAKGHCYADWKVTTEPTMTQDGVKTRTCSSCGDKETEVLPKTGITVKITDVNGNVIKEIVVPQDEKQISIDDVPYGKYTVEFSKESYVTRTYLVSSTGGEILIDEIELYKLGDVTGDGRVNAIDVARANAHAKGVNALSGYDLACVDVNGDGRVNAIDVALINAHSKGTKSLW